jgi:hypothetical protein
MAEQPGAPEDLECDACDIILREDEITSDTDLPAAAGGVAAVRGKELSEDADGRDDADTNFEPTKDEDLPAATGGVA